jgi:hypothetical protein
MYRFLLVCGDIISCIGHDHGKQWCKLIMHHNTLNSCLLLSDTMVGHNSLLDKCCHLSSQVVLLEM